MANYLVTGGAGFIGAAIVNQLVDNEHTITVIDNLRTGYRENVSEKAKFIYGDFSQDSVIEQLENEYFDAIFHIGGQSSGEISFEDPEYDLNTNTLSTLKLLQYCVKTGCKKFIYASTMSVYGEQEGKEQFSEEDETQPKSFYAVGKLASEKYMEIFSRQYGIDYTALRYFNVYGPGQNLENLKQGMVSIYLKQFLDDAYPVVEVKGSPDRFRDLIYIEDVVQATIDSLHNKKTSNQIINIGTGKKTTVETILKLIKEYTSSKKKITITDGTPGDQFGIYADIGKFSDIYQIDPIPFSEGLRKMIQWIDPQKKRGAV
jgi:UDP-glucose 4-epimerase